MEPEDLPQVTVALLRRADDLCRRRLAHELRGGKRVANKQGNMRFAVSNRLDQDARLAQAELGPPRADAFVDPAELEPEQRALYHAAVRGYLRKFGAAAGQVADHDDLGMRMSVPELGVDLVGNVGLGVEHPDGGRELRKVSLGGRRAGARLVDEVERNVALVRTRDWAPDALTIVAVDVIDQFGGEPDIVELPAERDAAMSWLTARVGLVRELAADGRARPGADCQSCAFVSGCEKHAG